MGDLKTAGFDPDSLWQRVNCDLDLLRDLIGVFQEEFPELVGRIEAAIQQGDAAALIRSAHKLNGSLLQFSARSAASAARQLEELGRRGNVSGAETLVQTLRHEVDLLVRSLDSMVIRMAGGTESEERTG